MFLLKILPDEAALAKFEKKYSDMDRMNVRLGLKLLKASSLILQDLERYFSSRNLSLAKFLALIVLERHKEKYMPHGEVSENMGISQKNTSRLLISLRKEDYISITPSGTDRRVKLIAITPKGKRKLNSVLPEYYRLINAIFDDLNTSQKKTTETALDRMLGGY